MSEQNTMQTPGRQVWFITGAGRGMGVDIAQAALTAGHVVVGTARDATKVTAAVGERGNLLAVSLDVTDPRASKAAVEAAVERFGRIDVLVNNAGNFYAGYFEEISPEQFRAQMETNFFGPLHVTRPILPVMHAQRSGHVITITSAAGIIGQEFCAAYAASKFALEGWMESLHYDLAPYGIDTTIVEPGFFRTELLVEGASSIWPELSIADYAQRTTATITAWKSMNGHQAGDPAKLGAALVTFAALHSPPLRFVAGADVLAGVEHKAQLLLDQVDAHRDLSSAMAIDNAQETISPLSALQMAGYRPLDSEPVGDVARCVGVERYGRRSGANLNTPSAESVARSVCALVRSTTALG